MSLRNIRSGEIMSAVCWTVHYQEEFPGIDLRSGFRKTMNEMV
jgi:hypothetical protein